MDRFSGSVAAVTSGMLSPGADRAFSVYGAGATFGQRFSASFEVLAARLKYHDALVSITTSLAGFVNASQILVDAVGQARARYASTDVLAAATVGGVDSVLSHASAAAGAASVSAPLLASDASVDGAAASVMGDPADWQPAACTAWGRFTVPQLWDMVKDTGSGDVTFAQQRAWTDTHDLLTDHAKAIQHAKDDLLAVWPPSTSQAAAEFDKYTDSVLLRIKQFAVVAAANSGPTGGLAQALIAAKERLQPIYEEWVRKDTAQRREGVLDKIGDAVTFTDPDAWRAPLLAKAVSVMVATDEQVAQHRAQLQAPKPYFVRHPDPAAPPPAAGTGSSGGGGAGVGWVQPPAIARPVPSPALSAGGGGGGEDAGGVGTSGGAALAGVAAGAGGSAAVLPFVDTSAGRALAAGGVLGAVPGVVTGALTAGALGAGVGGRRGWGGLGGSHVPAVAGEGELAPVRPSAGSLQPGRLVGPGGVIGGQGEPMPGVGAGGGAGGRGAAARSTRVGRPGGVIGAQPGADRGGQPMGAAGSGGRRRGHDDERPGFDPDDPWSVEQGGPGVIVPAPEPTRHDPGPGVFGIDR